MKRKPSPAVVERAHLKELEARREARRFGLDDQQLAAAEVLPFDSLQILLTAGGLDGLEVGPVQGVELRKLLAPKFLEISNGANGDGHHRSQGPNGVGQPVTAVKTCKRAIVVKFRNQYQGGNPCSGF